MGHAEHQTNMNKPNDKRLHESAEAELALRDVKGRALKGVASLLVRQGIIRILGFVGMLYLARLLAPEMFGIFVIAQFVVTFFGEISNMGLSATLLRQKESVTEAELRTVFTIQQTVVIISLIILLGAAPQITAHYHLDASYSWLIRVMGIALVLSSLKTIPSILLQRQLRHDKLSLAEIAEHITYNVVAIVLAVLGYEVWSLVIATLLRGMVGTGLLFSMAWWKPRFGFQRKTALEILRFGVPVQLANFAVLANNAVIPILVGTFLGTAAVGYVNFAKKMLDALAYQPLVLAGRVQLRVFGRIQDNMQKLASTVERSLFLGSVFVMYMLAMLASLAKPFVQLVVTSKWEPALPLIYIMVSGYVMYLVLQPCMQLMKSLGDARSPLIATVLKFSVELIVFFILYPHLGLPGYAVANVIAILAMALFIIRRVKAIARLHIIGNTGPAFLAACLAGAVSYLANQALQNFTGMITGLIVGSISYFYVLGLVAGNKLSFELLDLASSVLRPKSIASSLVFKTSKHLADIFFYMPGRSQRNQP